ncbi:MAG TPA: hypothetical protein VM733_07995 [Thermoanaerobaculia bacterium]|nr:hypothetical protein [Thermoanaerobaculia bacterium]
MPQFSVDLDVLRDALFNHSLSQCGDTPLEAKLKSPLKIAQVAFSPALSVRVINRAEDKDAVVGTHIAFDAQSAWVKYTLTGDTDAKISYFSGSADVAASDYRRHAATDGAWDAVTGDLASPRSIFDLDDVRSLQPGEALALNIGGSLGATVSFSWSDVLASKLIDIVSEVPVALKLKSGAEISASVKVTDRFSVVISRTTDGHFRFAVKKAQSRNHNLAIDVSLGFDIGAKGIAADLLAQLPEDVAKKVESTIVSKLEAAARWKAATGFAYEYARIDEHEAIADFILLDDSKLADDHALMLDGDTEKIAAALRSDPQSRQLVTYLNESTLTRRSASGFSLGLGKWVLSAKTSSTFRMTTRQSLDGFRLMTAQGTRQYDEKNVPQNDFEWIIDLKAQMNEYAAAPTSLDFDYGLHLLATIERGAISDGDIARILDFAEMWGVCPPPPDTFADAIGQKGSLRVQLLLERDALIAAFADDVDVASFASPLAMAMPYSSTFPERRTYRSRLETYGAAWDAWLRNAPPRALSMTSGLSIIEKQGGAGSFAWITGEGHPQLRQNLESFTHGARSLHTLMTTAQPPDAIGAAYDALSAFWSQRLYVAAVGRWLVEKGVARASLQVELADASVVAV